MTTRAINSSAETLIKASDASAMLSIANFKKNVWMGVAIVSACLLAISLYQQIETETRMVHLMADYRVSVRENEELAKKNFELATALVSSETKLAKALVPQATVGEAFSVHVATPVVDASKEATAWAKSTWAKAVSVF